MYLAIDIVLVAVMAATLFKAVKRGFIVSLFSLLTVAVSVVAAMMFYKELSIYINVKFVYEHIEEYVLSLVSDAAAENGGVLDISSLTSSLPQGLRVAVEALGVDITEMLEGFAGSSEAFAVSLAVKISATLSNILAFVAIFFAAFIVLRLVCFVLDIFAKLPVLNGINKIFGLVLGALEALVLGIIIANVAVSLCSVYGAVNNDAALLDAAEKTVVAKFLVSIFPW